MAVKPVGLGRISDLQEEELTVFLNPSYVFTSQKIGFLGKVAVLPVFQEEKSFRFKIKYFFFFSGNNSDSIFLHLLEFSLASQAGARQTLPVFQRKLEQLAEQRGQIGAFQARVDVAINTMQVERENYIAARSQITDADIAFETANLVKNNILQQAGAAVLAQANQAPALALALLG